MFARCHLYGLFRNCVGSQFVTSERLRLIYLIPTTTCSRACLFSPHPQIQSSFLFTEKCRKRPKSASTTRSPTKPSPSSHKNRRSHHVHLRPHGLRLRPHRQFPHLRLPGHPSPLLQAPRLPPHPRNESHRRRRPHHRQRRRPTVSIRDYTEKYVQAFFDDCKTLQHRVPRTLGPRHRPHR